MGNKLQRADLGESDADNGGLCVIYFVAFGHHLFLPPNLFAPHAEQFSAQLFVVFASYAL
jgi:hypothetical protein